jgi:hypothetical protein
MELDKDTYTKDEVLEFINNTKNEYESKIAELQSKTQEYEDKIAELQNTQLQGQIKIELMKAGLSEDLFDLVYDSDIEKTKNKIAKLVEYKGKQTPIYTPSEYKKDDVYTKAEAKGDVKTMLNAKLAKLFQ